MTGEAAERRAHLAANLAEVQARVERACAQADRDPADVRLIVVTKFFPASDVRLLADLGIRDFGENRDQEAGPKFAELRADHDDTMPEFTLHFIGQVQSNKAASIARYADVVHAVDRPKLVGALDRAAGAAGRELGVLVQVDLDAVADPGRGGASPADVPTLATVIDVTEHLHLRGIMAVAPLDADPDEAFARLAELAHGIREQFPHASWISAGMSGDLDAAVRHGATHLRVGTAILGSRPPLR